jgi:hypothetical protein
MRTFTRKVLGKYSGKEGDVNSSAKGTVVLTSYPNKPVFKKKKKTHTTQSLYL